MQVMTNFICLKQTPTPCVCLKIFSSTTLQYDFHQSQHEFTLFIQVSSKSIDNKVITNNDSKRIYVTKNFLQSHLIFVHFLTFGV